MNKIIPIAVAVVLLIGGAIMQGKLSERWSTFPELAESAKALDKTPLDVGEWRGEEGPQLDERTKQTAGAVGAVNRRYSNTTLNETVTVDLVSGRPHDMYFHTPDRCYPAAGFERGGKQQSVKIEGIDAEFFTNTYIKSEPNGITNLRVYWAWSNDGKWTAPDDFKWKYGGNPSLYKLYVLVPVNNRDQSIDHNAATEFIRAFLPELQKTVFSNVKAPAQSAPTTPAKEPAADASKG